MNTYVFMVNRELKRVPLDFNWPLDKVWPGYLHSHCTEDCDECKEFAKILSIPLLDHGCPDFPILHPPTGEGYQLWETTSEGSPISPIFKTIEELCKWLGENPGGLTDRFTREDWLGFFRKSGLLVDMEGKPIFKETP